MADVDITNKVGVPLAQPSAPPMWEVFADSPPSYEEMQQLCRSARRGQAGQRAKLRGYVDSLRKSVLINAARAQEGAAQESPTLTLRSEVSVSWHPRELTTGMAGPGAARDASPDDRPRDRRDVEHGRG